ncbi:LuxR C-terminal-related transcriptional regulator [Consotaella salsifontis]|uniref:DNA-binding response regulator, NarL/FixJ family, contains REC and HTH domains n=1 Tax=Consotaella salsifontis TaxID=1365950 RepID=A0A1T4SY92_9HYPH|nr:response regulator transcription factor [Consotaella salsifontis]SKA32871.1 DNA-binding response regulator, NarL/FixJ family, contains REC and HTH domains [Consotaella salsifontis]
MQNVNVRQTKILIVDAMELRRAGLVSMIASWAASMDVETVSIAPAELRVHPLDDISLALYGVGGTSLLHSSVQECLAELRDALEGRPIVIVSDLDTAREAVCAVRSGAQGFIPTSLNCTVVQQALQFIRGGGTYFPPVALLKLSESGSRSGERDGGYGADAPDGVAADLTQRQRDVLALLQLGQSNKLIARELDMQESTVKVHVRQIMRKLGAANRTQVALLAVKAQEQKLAGEKLGAFDDSHLIGGTSFMSSGADLFHRHAPSS